MSNRKAFIDVIVKGMDELYPGSSMGALYKKQLSLLSDEKLEEYVEHLRNGVSKTPDYEKPRELLSIIVPPLTKNMLTMDHCLAVADKWGVALFERIWVTDPTTQDTFLTNVPHLIVDLPVARQAQTLESKISVPDDNKHVDERTGQVTGVSKGSSLSYPETQILLSQGLKASVAELLKFRGGDEKAQRVMTKSVIDAGEFSQKVFDNLDTKPKSVQTFGVYLKAMHLNNNL